MKSKILQNIGDGMTWPIPVEEMSELGWRLRHAGPTLGQPYHKNDCILSASVIDAYEELIRLPSRRRNEIIAKIRAAMKGER